MASQSTAGLSRAALQVKYSPHSPGLPMSLTFQGSDVISLQHFLSVWEECLKIHVPDWVNDQNIWLCRLGKEKNGRMDQDLVSKQGTNEIQSVFA